MLVCVPHSGCASQRWCREYVPLHRRETFSVQAPGNLEPVKLLRADIIGGKVGCTLERICRLYALLEYGSAHAQQAVRCNQTLAQSFVHVLDGVLLPDQLASLMGDLGNGAVSTTPCYSTALIAATIATCVVACMLPRTNEVIERRHHLSSCHPATITQPASQLCLHNAQHRIKQKPSNHVCILRAR